MHGTGHDAASIVARIAGLDTTAPTTVTPAQLVERFCDPTRRTVEEGVVIDRGFCGFDGSRGFDDGYDFMGYLDGRTGWRCLSEVGDWPHHFFATRHPSGDEARWTIIEYCEADLVVRRFDSQQRARAFYDTLPRQS
jgi:hypothetical protein